MFELRIGKADSRKPREREEEKEEIDVQRRVCTPALFRKLIEGVMEIAKDVEMKVTEEGISIQAMDDAQVSLVALSLHKTAFDEFRCDRNITLGIPLSKLLTILKILTAETNSSLYLSADDEASVLTIVFEGASKVSNYKLKLLSLDHEQYQPPQIQYSAVISMDSGEFQRVARTLGNFGDSLSIDADGEGVTFKQESDIADSHIFFGNKKQGAAAGEKENVSQSAPQNVLEVRAAGTTSVRITSKYLSAFGKTGVISERVVINLANEAPIFFEFPLNSMGHLTYFVAPRTDA